jgi:hypothetical protein
MAITWQDVVDIAPELSTIATGTQTKILAMVGRQVANVDNWGELIDDASAYLAAHLATLTQKLGNGPTASEGVGPLNRSYVSLLQFGMLGQTSYGIEYLRLARMTPAVLGSVT